MVCWLDVGRRFVALHDTLINGLFLARSVVSVLF